MPNAVLDLAMDLVSRPSVTPEDGGCQDLLIRRLEAIGFQVTRLPAGEVHNFWAERGARGPRLCFAGHTDVVPPGPREDWHSDPFTPTLHNGCLYGRGAADMKGSLAAMVVAAERFVALHPDHPGRLAFLITSDEEGIAVDGTRRVVEWLQAAGQSIDWCVVGEPSSEEHLGDCIKNGRRGSLNGRLTVHGIQGHIAYPEKADNPIHRSLRPLADLAARSWDQGNAHFPPTRLQFSNIHAGTGVGNVIPGSLQADFNFRFSPESTPEALQTGVEGVLDGADLRYSIDWQLSGPPFFTPPGDLVDAATQAIRAVTGREARLSTAGGTSDGRFIAQLGGQVLELGPINATIHKVNECVAAADLDQLAQIYTQIMTVLLSKTHAHSSPSHAQ
ncbi:succinyl-diaminopimelate desuccinylase [Acidithiobacillus sulfuriphilus]|uniref:Succinyl-diaminopimelate desuccinylase n=2 Tax=Acidithiobacillus sulfuriphilus TaxID=1867749 RepID=A0A3M8QZM7_9PROT|nr:succinyl-diaminopimelate desuccinylase [Acidithiobacillus sulfuriphilus]RNF61703.1 succinyl-diaminopimelate desuccinylase [Acidithiobacillus sulfuriphilus]